jgi:hypothetical protein
MAPLKPPPLEVVFQPPNDPGVKDVHYDIRVTPATGVVADSVLDDMFNAWRCGSCTYQNLGKAKGACTMCNVPHPIRTGLSLVVNEKGIVERSLKASCCGADTTRHYVAGTHFTAEMLFTFADGKVIYLRRWKCLHWSIAVGIWRGGYEFGKKSHFPHAKTCSPDLLHQ